MEYPTLLLISLLLPFAVQACATEPVQPVRTTLPSTSIEDHSSSGYLITASDAAAVRSGYAQYGIVLLRSLGHGLFELQLQTDPGITVVSAIARRSEGKISAVQYNHSYQTN